jgi:hypothetical protein
MACHIASVVYWLVSLFRDTAFMTDPHTIHFTSGSGTTIIWGCTALKQSFIWFWLIATVRPWNFQLSTINFQLSTFNFQLSTLNF